MGLGKFLLSFIMQEVTRKGHKTITLGTETEMRAYDLYKQSGFEIVRGTTIYQICLHGPQESGLQQNRE